MLGTGPGSVSPSRAGQALQSIGNLGLQLGKEPWMAPLHAVLLPSITRVKAFLDSLVEVDGTHGEHPGHAGHSLHGTGG